MDDTWSFGLVFVATEFRKRSLSLVHVDLVLCPSSGTTRNGAGVPGGPRGRTDRRTASPLAASRESPTSHIVPRSVEIQGQYSYSETEVVELPSQWTGVGYYVKASQVGVPYPDDRKPLNKVMCASVHVCEVSCPRRRVTGPNDPGRPGERSVVFGTLSEPHPTPMTGVFGGDGVRASVEG